MEEAAATLGATRPQTLPRVVLPALLPALLAGFGLAFARAVGEYGSVIFIAGNMPIQRDRAAADRDAAGAIRLCRCCRGRAGDAAAGLSRAAGAEFAAAGAAPGPEPGWSRPAAEDPRCAPPRRAGVLVGVLLLGLPLVVVFAEALRRGWPVAQATADPDTIAAIQLTLLVAAIAVPVNLIGGLAAAWCLAKHDFPGKRLLTTLIELPFPFPRSSPAWSSC